MNHSAVFMKVSNYIIVQSHPIIQMCNLSQLTKPLIEVTSSVSDGLPGER